MLEDLLNAVCLQATLTRLRACDAARVDRATRAVCELRALAKSARSLAPFAALLVPPRIALIQAALI